MRGVSLENGLEKLGRILSAQYGITVVFEGDQAMTDGKTITLPMFPNPSKELVQELNGFLDHEVAHVKFTGFEELPHIKTRFHKDMLNAVEDTRIERLMIQEFPGTQFHLNPLNEKYRAKMMEEETWNKIPYPIRVIKGIRDIMEGREPRIDADTEKYIELSREAAVELNDCKSTKELRLKTAEIIKKIIEEKEEEKKKESKGAGKGKGKSEGEAGSSKAKGDGDEPSEDDMLTAEDDARFDEHTHDVHGLLEEAIKKEIKTGTKPIKPTGYDRVMGAVFEGTYSIPSTTRFDKVIDHSAHGNPAQYAKMKAVIKPLVAPIRAALERVLKVQENAKWRLERERGTLDKKSLHRLASDKNYRTIFKDHTKTDTKNVAVELLIDLSGSMSGSKVQVAREAATAMGEALKDLGIPFEVTGFSSVPSREVHEFTKSLGAAGARFNRKSEALKLEVFKSFDAITMAGITKLQSSQQNPDGECVMWAAKRLSMRREKRKILIVFSDGEPCTGDSVRGILCSDLKNKVIKLKKAGIECVGIGIASEAVKSFYPDYLVLREIKDLPKSAMKKLSSLILKGA